MERLPLRCATLAFGLAFGLALSACDSAAPDALMPSQVEAETSVRTAAAAAADDLFHPNTNRYADTGAKPATGRAGGATLTVRALVGKDGVTDLESTTGEALDTDATPPHPIEKLQVKLLAPDGSDEAVWTRNYNDLTNDGYYAIEFEDILPGMPLQVQGNVLADRRAGVVTVATTALLRPDLVAEDLVAPAEAYPDQPVEISATIREGNGDVGATASCVLYVDGAEADRAEGVWVDADDAVSCAFSTTFSAVGTYALRVAAEDVVPGDYDGANNAVEGSIEIVDPTPPNEFYWYASFRNDNAPFLQEYTYDYYRYYSYYGYPYERHTRRGTKRQQQYSYVYGTKYGAAATFPLASFDVRFESGDAPVFEFTREDLPVTHTYSSWWGTRSCHQMPYEVSKGEGTVWANVCSRTGRYSDYTSINFRRYAGTVTYYGYQWSRSYWGPSYGSSYSYTYNYGGTVPDLSGSSEASFVVQVTDADGVAHSAAGAIPLNRRQATDRETSYCYGGYWSSSCTFRRQTFDISSGWARGYPEPSL